MQDEFGESPLIKASYCGHVATCRLLIERGATVDYQNKVRLLYVHHYCGVDTHCQCAWCII